jgi:hypothetical protein
MIWQQGFMGGKEGEHIVEFLIPGRRRQVAIMRAPNVSV